MEVMLRTETLDNQKDKPAPKRRTRRTADKVAAPVGGRPRKDMPVQLVLDLGAAGLSTREVADEVERQGGGRISAMTISRALADQRK